MRKVLSFFVQCMKGATAGSWKSFEHGGMSKALLLLVGVFNMIYFLL